MLLEKIKKKINGDENLKRIFGRLEIYSLEWNVISKDFEKEELSGLAVDQYLKRKKEEIEKMFKELSKKFKRLWKRNNLGDDELLSCLEITFFNQVKKNFNQVKQKEMP